MLWMFKKMAFTAHNVFNLSNQQFKSETFNSPQIWCFCLKDGWNSELNMSYTNTTTNPTPGLFLWNVRNHPWNTVALQSPHYWDIWFSARLQGGAFWLKHFRLTPSSFKVRCIRLASGLEQPSVRVWWGVPGQQDRHQTASPPGSLVRFPNGNTARLIFLFFFLMPQSHNSSAFQEAGKVGC